MARGFFETKRGRLLLGLAILSGGGTVITQAQARIEDPSIQQALQFLLVFWVILCARLTYTFAWLYQEGQEAQHRTAGVPVAIKSAAKAKPVGAAAAAATKEESGSDDEGSDAAAGKPRRRRTRRD